MLVFKEIELELNAVKERLGQLGAEVDPQVDEQRLTLLLSIIRYVKEMSWLTHKKTIQKVRHFLQYRYDYACTAAYFGVTIKSLHVSIGYAAKQLRSGIGLNTLSLIREGRLDEANRTFLIASGQVDIQGLLVDGFLNQIEAQPDDSIDFSLCEIELRLLLQYSRKLLERRVRVVDQARLKHLIYVLVGNDHRYDHERGILIQLLTGEIDVAGAQKVLKMESIYSG